MIIKNELIIAALLWHWQMHQRQYSSSKQGLYRTKSAQW